MLPHHGDSMNETLARLIDANRQLTKVNTQLQAFFDQSYDLLAIAEDGKFIKLSKSWEDVTGWSREELMSRPFAYFVANEDVGKTIEEDNKITATKTGTEDFVNQYRTKEGGTVTLQWRSRAIDGVSFAVARVINGSA